MRRPHSLGPAGLVVLACWLQPGVGGAGLEATLIAVDNSGYMINSDHRPSRHCSLTMCLPTGEFHTTGTRRHCFL